jgi:hypothetical protein
VPAQRSATARASASTSGVSTCSALTTEQRRSRRVLAGVARSQHPAVDEPPGEAHAHPHARLRVLGGPAGTA